jgi:serine/threonine protein phosphatase PrpC
VIAEVLGAGGDAQALIDRALAPEREGQDNVTCIVVRV